MPSFLPSICFPLCKTPCLRLRCFEPRVVLPSGAVLSLLVWLLSLRRVRVRGVPVHSFCSPSFSRLRLTTATAFVCVQENQCGRFCLYSLYFLFGIPYLVALDAWLVVRYFANNLRSVVAFRRLSSLVDCDAGYCCCGGCRFPHAACLRSWLATLCPFAATLTRIRPATRASSYRWWFVIVLPVQHDALPDLLRAAAHTFEGLPQVLPQRLAAGDLAMKFRMIGSDSFMARPLSRRALEQMVSFLFCALYGLLCSCGFCTARPTRSTKYSSRFFHWPPLLSSVRAVCLLYGSLVPAMRPRSPACPSACRQPGSACCQFP